MEVNEASRVSFLDDSQTRQTGGTIAGGLASATIEGAALGALGSLAMIGIELYFNSPHSIDLTGLVTSNGIRGVSRGAACGAVIAVTTAVVQQMFCG